MSSRKRLTWRTLRDASERPFLWASSSSSTTIGRYTSCSSKRKIAVGSCMSTFVSITKRRRWVAGRATARSSPAEVPTALPESERLRRFKYFLRVTVHFHFPPLAPQHSAAVDEKRAAHDAEHFATIHVLFVYDVEQPAQILFLIGQELE